MSWQGDFVKDYLTFSRKERNGIFIILFLCTFTWIGARYFPIPEKHFDKGAFQNELAQLTISIDSSRKSYTYQNDDDLDYNRPRNYYSNEMEGELFHFDPNTLSVAGWKKLGVREKTITTIQKFIGKGYRFREAEDLRKIYGLSKNTADRLIPFIQIAAEEPSGKIERAINTEKSARFERDYPSTRRISTVDINTADTASFISLPGIGSKLAARIVSFRERLGGFSSVNQLGETYGLPDSTFQNIRARLTCESNSIKKINVNTAEANELKSHPYLKWNIANAIVNYRKQHGSYKSLNDLRKIEIISEELFEKIVPYLIL